MPRFRTKPLARLEGERMAGAAASASHIVTWGDRLLAWEPPYVRPVVLQARGSSLFGEGGCLAPAGDGFEVIVTERLPRPALVRFGPPAWKRRVIETGVQAKDVSYCTLHGRKGVLLVHRGAQVRFYPMPEDGAPRDVYSFYTPSSQGGLLLADINGDGCKDIVCGNYWIQAPPEFDLPWRLFAINTWNEEERSAMTSFAWTDEGLVACQREMAPARLALFEKPADPRRLWSEHRLDGGLGLDRPRILAVLGQDLLIGELGGRMRLLLCRRRGPAMFDTAVLESGRPLFFAHPWQGGMVCAGPAGLFNLTAV